MDVHADVALLVALGGLVILTAWLGGQNLKLQRQKNLTRRYADLSSLYETLKSKTDSLWQYQGIHKVDLEIAKRKEQIKQYTLAVKLKAEEIINNAKAESRDIRSKVRAFVEKSKTNAAQTIELAKSQAATIVSTAETSAREIAGSALDAKNRTDEYEKTAIEFGLDAFNGKVDSILTNVRHDNFGKLAQQIKDAFQTVNHNGTAFRNARISDLYLANRLNELKWAVATYEPKIAEIVISNIGSFGQNVFKIGMTRRLEPLDRIKELGDASVPFDFDVHAIINTEDAPQLEKELHNCFDNSRVNKVNTRKEFFSVNLAEVRKAIEDLGIQAHWTMKAEAIQFRESNAMAQTMKLVVSKSA